ncbi:MAG TPA: hypothetical protein PKM43_16980 [Verrucomicrobiota bacterium]|nr:hypothetical protein [Verrucomicrobiota bacterium]HRZ37046.1 hypothetical protein [Candidatus Paceibacterota bacterium]HRZ54612.1 hypothetical protein [Candidatus Paceibacterota bacterium]
MNRAILIIITDFWILSLLVLAKFDAPDVQRPQTNPTVSLQGTSAGEKDVVEVLKLALSEEQKRRDALASELSATRQNLDLREQTVAAREQQLRALQQSLREKEQLGVQLSEQRTNLIEQMVLAQTNVVFLRDQLQTASTESLLTQEQLKLLQTQLARKEEELTKTRQRVEQLDRQRESTLMEKAQLSAQLQVVETEKRLVTQQVSHLSNEVQIVRAEKSTLQQHATQLAQGVDALAEKSTALVQGVDALAEKSTALTQEIRENRELAANAIFAELATNRVTLRFAAQRKGLFGIPVQNDKTVQTILVSHANQYFALCHVSDTPLTFSTPGFGFDSFQVSLEHGTVAIPAAKVMFLSIDPRILMVPLSEAEARQFGVRIYQMAADPLKFTEAVLVGATEGYYGESKFQIDLSAPLYVRMDRSSFRIFSSKFNPSRGDLVLSKTGELLGVMANSQYCAVLNRLNTIGEVASASETSASAMGSMLSRFDRALQQLPMKLQ